MSANNDELKNLVESNARAIEALTSNVAEIQRERARFYGAMADLTQAQSVMYRRLETFDDILNQLNRRQGEIVEILKLLTSR